MKTNLKDYTIQELEEITAKFGEPKFRAKQIFEWLYRGVRSFDEMTNLPKAFRERLEEKFSVSRVKKIGRASCRERV